MADADPSTASDGVPGLGGDGDGWGLAGAGGGGSDPRTIALRLAALPERAMRAATLAWIVARLSPLDAAWLLDALATVGRAGGPPFDLALLAAVDLGAEARLAYEARRTIFDAANRHGLEACKELLYTGVDETDDEALAPRALVPGTRPLTLGERKSLARSWKRAVLERLVADPAPDVVALLLANPHLTEVDVLKIATARRSSAAVLSLVLQSPRWAVRPAVRRALVRNPKLPEADRVRLVGLLNRAEMLEMSRDPRLPLRVLAALQRRLRPVM
jgi:hypothetical protein